jgi:hypothetical protein
MPDKIVLPLLLLPNLLPILEGVFVRGHDPTLGPVLRGPYRALIDTGASHSWVKPYIGDFLQPHSLEGYVVEGGDGVEVDANSIEVMCGFMKGLSGKPVSGKVQLEARLPFIEILLFSGDLDAPVDLVIGMDIISSFIQCGVLIRGTQTPSMLAIEF